MAPVSPPGDAKPRRALKASPPSCRSTTEGGTRPEEVSVGCAGFGEDLIQPEVGDTLEMAEVARYEFEVVVEGRSCDLQIGVGEDVSAALQIGADLPEHPSSRDIIREGGYRRKNTGLDVLQVVRLGGNSEIASVSKRYATVVSRVRGRCGSRRGPRYSGCD